MADPKRTHVVEALTPAARETTIAALQEHYARNHLEVQDFETRVDQAENARTGRDLERALEGLPALELTPSVPPPVAAVTAFLGATTRRGRWRVPEHVRLRAILGSIEADLCDAELSPGGTLIEVDAWLGSITLTIPEGLAVECEGTAVLGSFDHLAQGPASRRDARVVRIVGSARLGSVEIIVKPRTGMLEGIRALLGGK